MPIKLMTYNICSGYGMDKQRDINRALKVMRDSGAEIICIQEIDRNVKRSSNIDQPKYLADALGMHHIFQGNLELEGGLYGIAILTKFAIIENKNHKLTSFNEPRGILEITVQTENGPLEVFCTHFGLDSAERKKQAEEVSEIVSSAKTAKVVCGDFNEEVTAEGVAHLIRSTGLVDSDPNGSLTFDSKDPYTRIDLILHSPEIEIISINTIDSFASDHKALVADLRF